MAQASEQWRERHAKLLLDSHLRLTGKELLRPETGRGLMEQLDEAPFVILSHGTESDPMLNYGNRMAMKLWEMDWERFTSTPSRLTAEPMEREERARFLARVSADGYVDNYTGIRISSTGRRFFIEDVTVWNLHDRSGAYRGQAAAFLRCRYI